MTLKAARDTTTIRPRYGPRGRAGDGRPIPAARGDALHRTLPPRPLSTSHTSNTTSHDAAPYCTTIHLPKTFFYPLSGASSPSSPIRSTPRHVEPPLRRPGGSGKPGHQPPPAWPSAWRCPTIHCAVGGSRAPGDGVQGGGLHTVESLPCKPH